MDDAKIKNISADLWNAIGNKTPAVAKEFGINGWYDLVKEVLDRHCGNGRNLIMAARLCPNSENHTLCPEDYIQWHEWAKSMDKTHKQIKCKGCGLYTIWVPRTHRRKG